MTAEFDVVVAGGGLSGLSLVAHLASSRWGDRSVLLVDDAEHRPGAVRWGSWTDRPGLLDAATSRWYKQVRVHAAGADGVVPLGRYRYRSVRRADLCRVVHGMLMGRPGFVARRGRVEEVVDGPDHAEVLVDGQRVEATWAFDSVTPPPAGGEPDARLAFTGWELECARPVFDPDSPTLFDFRTAQAAGPAFVYVLPDDRHHALVEITAFVPRRLVPPSRAARCDALAEYLDTVLHCGGFRVACEESAVLPLHVRPPRESRQRVRAIGARAGLVKASTGYAYERIQRDSDRITASLTRWDHPFGATPAHRRHRLLDAVMLEALDHDPSLLEEMFARLFLRNPAERVLRFLDEDSGVGDELRLIASLPPVPYLRATAGRIKHRAGRRDG